jgi:hypothetical protein
MLPAFDEQLLLNLLVQRPSTSIDGNHRVPLIASGLGLLCGVYPGATSRLGPLLMFVTQAKHWLISRGRQASRRSKTVILTAKKVGFWSPHPVRNAPTCSELRGAPPHDAQLNYFQIADDTAGRSSAPTSATCKSQCECIQRTGQTDSSRAITDQCACTITHPGPRTLNGSSILTQPSVGRS